MDILVLSVCYLLTFRAVSFTVLTEAVCVITWRRCCCVIGFVSCLSDVDFGKNSGIPSHPTALCIAAEGKCCGGRFVALLAGRESRFGNSEPVCEGILGFCFEESSHLTAQERKCMTFRHPSTSLYSAIDSLPISKLFLRVHRWQVYTVHLLFWHSDPPTRAIRIFDREFDAAIPLNSIRLIVLVFEAVRRTPAGHCADNWQTPGHCFHRSRTGVLQLRSSAAAGIMRFMGLHLISILHFSQRFPSFPFTR
jgi:hypothetical protein